MNLDYLNFIRMRMQQEKNNLDLDVFTSSVIGVLKMGSERAVADMVVEMVNGNSERFKVLYKLCFNTSYPLCMRAARVVQLCCCKNPQLIMPYADEVIELLQDTKVDGVKRNFLKIFDEFIELQGLENLGLLLNLCFDWLSNSSETIAVRMFSMGVIYKISKFEPDIRTELEAIINAQLEFETSSGFINRALKILKWLAKSRKN